MKNQRKPRKNYIHKSLVEPNIGYMNYKDSYYRENDVKVTSLSKDNMSRVAYVWKYSFG